MTGRLSTRRRIRRIAPDATRDTVDALAVEEPLEIRMGGEPVAVTMRTPGSDFELAAGFCLTEGLVDEPGDIASIRYCAGTDPDPDPDTGPQAFTFAEPGSTKRAEDRLRRTYKFAEPGSTKRAEDRLRRTYNTVDVARRDGRAAPPELRRRVYTTSSCGICGTTSIDALRRDLPDIDDDITVPADVLSGLPDAMRAAQQVFDRTGGLHAAARFTSDGRLIDLREDVGRHNAVDKLIGHAALQDALPLTGQVLLVSGRVAFEIVQKALHGRIPIIAAVSAPTSLAAELATSTNMTLVGFLRGQRMNVYAGWDRIT